MGVEFNDENQQKASILYARIQSSNQVPGLEQWLIGKGVVKTPGQANIILIGLIIVILAAAGYLFASSGDKRPELTTDDEARLSDMMRQLDEINSK